MTATRSDISAMTPMSWVIKHNRRPVFMAQASQEGDDLGLESKRREPWFGSSAMMRRGLAQMARAITTRCRIPPENSWG